MYYIYTLTDPRDNQVRYVGMSTNPEQRYKQHVGMIDYAPVKDAWIRGVIDSNTLPLLSIVDEAETEQQARASEARWILHFHSVGSELVNKEVHDAKKDGHIDDLLRKLRVRALRGIPQTPINIELSTPEPILDETDLSAENERLRAENAQLCNTIREYEALMSHLVSSLEAIKGLQSYSNKLLKTYTQTLETPNTPIYD